MDDLQCPVCGQINPSNSETCSNCGSSLHAPIRPGELPTEKITSDLEPILPDWLREAREKASESGSNEIDEPSKKDAHPFGGSADLLAGLDAQSKGEEDLDLPDWLAGITGGKAGKKEPPEITGARRVELGEFEEPEPGVKPPVPSSTQASDLPSWLSGPGPTQPEIPQDDNLRDWFKQAAAPPSTESASAVSPEEPAPPSSSSEESVLDWLSSLQSEVSGAGTPQAPESGLPSWLSGAEDQVPPTSPAGAAGMPDWLKELGSISPEPASPSSLPPASGESLSSEATTPFQGETPASEPEAFDQGLVPAELPDWLKDLSGSPAASEDLPGQPPMDWLAAQDSEDTPLEPAGASTEDAGGLTWLGELQEAASPEPEKSISAFHEPDLPPEDETADLDWLKDVQKPLSPVSDEKIPTPAVENEPDWFPQAGSQIPTAADSEALLPSALDVELPDWLKNASPESLAASNEEVQIPDWMKSSIPGTSEAPAVPEEVPDWWSTPSSTEGPSPVSSGQAADEQGEPAPERTAKPGWLSRLPSLEMPPTGEAPSTPEGDELPLPALPGEALPSGDMDSLFTAVPDWLSEAAPDVNLETPAAPLQAAQAESLSPANLPSWVQAMRPVEASGTPAFPGAAGEENTLETQGPLAGLRGVLPSLPYLAPASKPQAQSFKLQASSEQQNHGALLELILQSETHPAPMSVAPRLATQKGLRIALGLLLFLVLLGVVFAGTQLIPLPFGWPAEAVDAVRAVESIPAGSSVLVIFDYEPSLAGEMEAAAAPLLDHLIVRNHPHLDLISTSPTGTALADRLFAGPLQPLAFQDRINLGYLPGGLGGVRSFAQDPLAAMPLTADSTPLTAGAQRLSDYAGILLITDSLDGGRTWIEQAGPLYSGTAFVVVSSAQAGPMLQPYYHSGQIHGLVSGLFDAAVLEQNNAGRPGLARRYWDAYNAGLILAVLLITLGALWNLAAGLRDRASAEAG